MSLFHRYFQDIHILRTPSDTTKQPKTFSTGRIIKTILMCVICLISVFRYRWFLQNVGVGQSNDDIEISMDKHYKDKFVVCFDLSHRGDNGFMPQANDKGTISYRCEFGETTSKALTLLVLASFESNVLVDKDKNVSMDYV